MIENDMFFVKQILFIKQKKKSIRNNLIYRFKLEQYEYTYLPVYLQGICYIMHTLQKSANEWFSDSAIPLNQSLDAPWGLDDSKKKQIIVNKGPI